LCRDLFGIQDGQLSRIAQRLRAELACGQALEQPVALLGPRNDHHAVPAPQPRLDECERRLGERVTTTILALGIAVKLGEMMASGCDNQKVAAIGLGHRDTGYADSW